MIARFSLYGFLKNQRYFEPFLMLAFLEKGFSFFQIGVLIGFREICRNLMEIPSGAIADLYGRRKAMMMSFGFYIGSFVIFGLSKVYWQFFFAMLLFAMGDAFRTGTHKAMIFTWLRLEGRTEEKTQVYGYTRSWSKIGSAVSVVLGAGMVFTIRDYSIVFYLSIVPYLLGLVNFMGYPQSLEGRAVGKTTVPEVLRHLREALQPCLHVKPLRRLMLESMGFEGMFTAAKDYLQPILQVAALALPIGLSLGDKQRGALLVGTVYFLLYVGSAVFSRKAHRLVDLRGGESAATHTLWQLNLLVYLGLLPLMYFECNSLIILGFIALYLMQNIWRPILISRFDDYASEAQGATILSIESQAKSVATLLIAPLLGASIDGLLKLQQSGDYTHGVFWPIGLLGALFAGAALLSAARSHS